MSECQHCNQQVQWGQTEQGFAGFVHTANGLSTCPQPTEQTQRNEGLA